MAKQRRTLDERIQSCTTKEEEMLEKLKQYQAQRKQLEKQKKAEEIRKDAVAIFKALDCSGLSRVDFFLTKDTNEVVFNEINTLPGFTAISMYPMLWEARGLSKKALVQKLIDLAMNRYDV